MIAEYSMNLKNKSKDELISLLEDALKIIKKQEAEIEKKNITLKVCEKKLIEERKERIKNNEIMRAIIKAYKQDVGSDTSIESTIKYFENELRTKITFKLIDTKGKKHIIKFPLKKENILQEGDYLTEEGICRKE